MGSNHSDIARIREQIALEYEAASRVLTGFTATARHEYITARQANIAACFNELRQHMSPQEAMQVVLEVEQEVYRCAVLPRACNGARLSALEKSLRSDRPH